MGSDIFTKKCFQQQQVNETRDNHLPTCLTKLLNIHSPAQRGNQGIKTFRGQTPIPHCSIKQLQTALEKNKQQQSHIDRSNHSFILIYYLINLNTTKSNTKQHHIKLIYSNYRVYSNLKRSIKRSQRISRHQLQHNRLFKRRRITITDSKFKDNNYLYLFLVFCSVAEVTRPSKKMKEITFRQLR